MGATQIVGSFAHFFFFGTRFWWLRVWCVDVRKFFLEFFLEGGFWEETERAVCRGYFCVGWGGYIRYDRYAFRLKLSAMGHDFTQLRAAGGCSSEFFGNTPTVIDLGVSPASTAVHR